MGNCIQPREYQRHATRCLAPTCDLELRQLRAFVALIDHGSVTAAAHALKLAQSTVSEALAALERTLGTPVIHRRRGTHDSVLTAAGQVLLPNARAVLATVDKTYIAVAKAAVEARGAVGIVANESISTYVLPQVLAPLRRRWPNTCFSVSVATCSEIRQGIEDGTFDVGLMLEEPTRSGTTTPNQFAEPQVVAPVVPLVIFVTPIHPLARRERQEPAARSELAGFSMFVSDPAGEFHALINRFLLADDLPTARLHSTGSIEGVKRGVVTDPHALGILPSYAIAEELRAGRIVHLDIRPVPPTMRLVALLSQVRERHPSAVELLEDITRLFAVRMQPKAVAGTRLT